MRSISKNPRETRQRDYDFSPSTVGRRYSARLEEIWKNHAVDPRNADFSRHGLNREDAKVAKERKEDLSRKKVEEWRKGMRGGAEAGSRKDR